MKTLLTTFFLLFLTITTFACDPIFYGFEKSICHFNEENIFVGKIVDQGGQYADIAIIDQVRGCESQNAIRIWDGSIYDCNGPFDAPATALGEVGDSVLFIAQQIDTLENTWDVLGDYRRPVQFNYPGYVLIENGLVSVSINQNWQLMPYAGYIQHLKDNDTENCLEECTEVALSTHNNSINSISIYPNPSSDQLFIESTSTAIQSIRIFNTLGELIHHTRQADHNQSINVSAYAQGIYYAHIKAGDALEVRKIIVH